MLWSGQEKWAALRKKKIHFLNERDFDLVFRQLMQDSGCAQPTGEFVLDSWRWRPSCFKSGLPEDVCELPLQIRGEAAGEGVRQGLVGGARG